MSGDYPKREQAWFASGKFIQNVIFDRESIDFGFEWCVSWRMSLKDHNGCYGSVGVILDASHQSIDNGGQLISYKQPTSNVTWLHTTLPQHQPQSNHLQFLFVWPSRQAKYLLAN